MTAAERKTRQVVLIDVGMEIDVLPAARGDDFRKTADYAAVERLVRGEAEAGERQLVETLAERTAQAVLRADSRIRSVEVAARKAPAAMPRVREIVVKIRRGRNG